MNCNSSSDRYMVVPSLPRYINVVPPWYSMPAPEQDDGFLKLQRIFQTRMSLAWIFHPSNLPMWWRIVNFGMAMSPNVWMISTMEVLILFTPGTDSCITSQSHLQ